MSQPAIRAATRGDLPRLSELFRQEVEHQQKLAGCFRLVDDVDWEEHVAFKMRRADTEILVAEHTGALVGFVEVSVSRRGSRLRTLADRVLFRGESRCRATIEDVYVVPAMRKQGCATLLVEHAVRWARGHNAGEILAGIWATNEASIRFFKRLGFEPVWLIVRKAFPSEPPSGSLVEG